MTNIRDEIENNIKALVIDRKRFHEVDKMQWKSIMKKIVNTFLQINRYNYNIHWGWEVLKEPVISLRFREDNSYIHLDKIIKDDTVWFIAEDSFGHNWLYEGNITEVIKIIENSYAMEYYIVSKKYDWLISENHHNTVNVCGELMITLYLDFLKENNKLIKM